MVKTQKDSKRLKKTRLPLKVIGKIASILTLSGMLYYFGKKIKNTDFKKDVFKNAKEIQDDNIGHKIYMKSAKSQVKKDLIKVNGQVGRYGLGYTGQDNSTSKKRSAIKDPYNHINLFFVKSTK